MAPSLISLVALSHCLSALHRCIGGRLIVEERKYELFRHGSFSLGVLW